MKKLFSATGLINAVCLVALILFTGIQLPAFGMWFYRWQYDVNNTYEVVNMEPEHLHEVTRHMIHYMQGREPDLQITTTVGGEVRPFFSEIELRHMEDVYDLFAVGLMIQSFVIGLFLATLGAFLLWGRERLWVLFQSWKIAAASVFLGLATLVAVIAINWHHAFVVFHEIFFNNDYWILDPRVDLLINIVPYPFFITISAFIGGFFAVGLVAMFVAGRLAQRRVKKP